MLRHAVNLDVNGDDLPAARPAGRAPRRAGRARERRQRGGARRPGARRGGRRRLPQRRHRAGRRPRARRADCVAASTEPPARSATCRSTRGCACAAAARPAAWRPSRPAGRSPQAWPTPDGPPAADLFAAAAAGDVKAVAVRDRFCWGVASAIRALGLTIDPERIVLGGGVSEVGEPLREQVGRAAEGAGGGLALPCLARSGRPAQHGAAALPRGRRGRSAGRRRLTVALARLWRVARYLDRRPARPRLHPRRRCVRGDRDRAGLAALRPGRPARQRRAGAATPSPRSRATPTGSSPPSRSASPSPASSPPRSAPRRSRRPSHLPSSASARPSPDTVSLIVIDPRRVVPLPRARRARAQAARAPALGRRRASCSRRRWAASRG